MKRSGDITAVLPPSGTVTFLFSDIEGSTRRWARDGDAMQAALRLHDQHMRSAIAAHDGYIFKTIGDAFCAAFAKPKSAVLAALKAQRALGATEFSAVDGLRVRMAINAGTADERDGDYFGPTLNHVARLLPLGHGGQVLLSSVAAELVRMNLPSQVTLADLGEHVLKDYDDPERVYQLVAPELQRDFPELRSLKALQPWLVPESMRTRYFTGRDDLLERVRDQLRERHRAALSGLGGVGKTQTAIEYAVRNRTAYPNGVFWVNAETPAGIASGFVEIARTLRLPAAESHDQELAVTAVLEWLNRSYGWLLILDNVEERGNLRRFVPDHGKGDVLITSREPVFAELGVPRSLELRDLDTDEAVRFLLARTGRDDAGPSDRAAAAELVAQLGNLPLALEQAAAYLAEANASFSAYLGAFCKRRVALLERAVGLVAHDTIAVTWTANFDAVERTSPAAAEVLRIAAFLAPDAIPCELFLDGAKVLGDSIAQAFADPDELAMAEVLRPLARYSLIRFDGASRAFSVHRLVQEVVRISVVAAERQIRIERALRALGGAFPNVEYANWPQCERLVPHVVSLVGWVESSDIHVDVTGLLNQTGFYLDERGRYSEAQPLLERAVAIRTALLGPDHPEVALSLNYLALVHWHAGRDGEAELLHGRALAIRERALGPEHPDVASSLNNLARIYLKMDRFVEARPLLERALSIREHALGPDHLHVASSLNNLGIVYWGLGRYAEAELLFKRALEIRDGALGPDHPDVATFINNLAHFYTKQGRYGEAQALHERSLANLERSLGTEHPTVAISLDNLAQLHLKQGQLAEAERLFERALAIRERALGPDHPDVGETLAGLGSLRKDQGHNPEALALFERAVLIKERTLAADHPLLAEIRNAIDALRATTNDIGSLS